MKGILMSKVHNSFRSALLTSMIVTSAGFSLTALAQTPGPMGMNPHHMQGMHGGHAMMNDPKREAHRAERHQKHLSELKVFLQLQASQEAAWTAFETVMKPPMKRHMAAVPADMGKMSTPERIDKMMAIKAERDAEITKRMNASKTFYGALTPAQQKVFDTHTQKFLKRH
jgi:hypothetical protein